MNKLQEFIKKFTEKEIFPENELVKQGREFYLQKKNIQETTDKIGEELIHAGIYLGETKSNIFTTSLHLLELISPHTNKKVVLDENTAWLFACGRDVFVKNIENNFDIEQGEFVIVVNKRSEVLGLAKKSKDKNNIIYKNIIDIGDYLRREQKKKKH